MAETEAGTVGNGLGGVSFLIFGLLASGLVCGELGFATCWASSGTCSSCTAFDMSDTSSFARFTFRSS